MENTSFKDALDGKYLHHLHFGSAAHAACRSLNNSERLFSLRRKIILDENVERLWKGFEKKKNKSERKSMASLCSGETEITWETSAFLPLGSFCIFAKGSGKVEATSSPAHTRARGTSGTFEGKVPTTDPKSWTFLEFPPQRSPGVSVLGAAPVL